MWCSYWGEPVVYGPINKQPSAEACCNACSTYKPATDEDLDCNGVIRLLSSPALLAFMLLFA